MSTTQLESFIARPVVHHRAATTHGRRDQQVRQAAFGRVDRLQGSKLLNSQMGILIVTLAWLFVIGCASIRALEGYTAEWTILNSFYFLGMTVSLTGFGDLVPKSEGSKVFISIYCYFAVGCVFTICWRVSYWWRRSLGSTLRQVAISLFVLVSMALFFAVLFMQLEQWNFLDSLYLCSNALGAIGYGNLTPKSPAGKIIFASLLGFVGLPFYGAASYTLVDTFRTHIVLATYYRCRRKCSRQVQHRPSSQSRMSQSLSNLPLETAVARQSESQPMHSHEESAELHDQETPDCETHSGAEEGKVTSDTLKWESPSGVADGARWELREDYGEEAEEFGLSEEGAEVQEGSASYRQYTERGQKKGRGKRRGRLLVAAGSDGDDDGSSDEEPGGQWAWAADALHLSSVPNLPQPDRYGQSRLHIKAGVAVLYIQLFGLCILLLVALLAMLLLLIACKGNTQCGPRGQYNMASAAWFIFTTLTCVGYGDITDQTSFFPNQPSTKLFSILFTPLCMGFQLMCLTLFVTFLEKLRLSLRQTLALSCGMLAVVFAYSLLVFVPLEGWSVVNTLYWVHITLSTVGYGDVVPTRGLTRLLAVPVVFGEYFYFLTIITLATRYVDVVKGLCARCGIWCKGRQTNAGRQVRQLQLVQVQTGQEELVHQPQTQAHRLHNEADITASTTAVDR